MQCLTINCPMPASLKSCWRGSTGTSKRVQYILKGHNALSYPEKKILNFTLHILRQQFTTSISQPSKNYTTLNSFADNTCAKRFEGIVLTVPPSVNMITRFFESYLFYLYEYKAYNAVVLRSYRQISSKMISNFSRNSSLVYNN